MTEKVDRKVEKETTKKWEGEKKHFKGWEVTEIWAHQAELVRKSEKRKERKEIKKANGTMGRWAWVLETLAGETLSRRLLGGTGRVGWKGKTAAVAGRGVWVRSWVGGKLVERDGLGGAGG